MVSLPFLSQSTHRRILPINVDAIEVVCFGKTGHILSERRPVGGRDPLTEDGVVSVIVRREAPATDGQDFR